MNNDLKSLQDTARDAALQGVRVQLVLELERQVVHLGSSLASFEQ